MQYPVKYLVEITFRANPIPEPGVSSYKVLFKQCHGFMYNLIKHTVPPVKYAKSQFS